MNSLTPELWQALKQDFKNGHYSREQILTVTSLEEIHRIDPDFSFPEPLVVSVDPSTPKAAQVSLSKRNDVDGRLIRRMMDLLDPNYQPDLETVDILFEHDGEELRTRSTYDRKEGMEDPVERCEPRLIVMTLEHCVFPSEPISNAKIAKMAESDEEYDYRDSLLCWANEILDYYCQKTLVEIVPTAGRSLRVWFYSDVVGLEKINYAIGRVHKPEESRVFFQDGRKIRRQGPVLHGYPKEIATFDDSAIKHILNQLLDFKQFPMPVDAFDDPDTPVSTGTNYTWPTFPYDVMTGTSLYEGLVKPVLDNSSKHPEFLFMPGVQTMLNYLDNRVSLKDQDLPTLNMFLGLISPYGKFFKSTSAELAHAYFKSMGMLDSVSPRMNNSNSKVLVSQVGSSEGFGKQMYDLNCHHAIYYSDELQKLAAKVGIENSSLMGDILIWYGAGFYGNSVKNRKDMFSFEPHTYCFSVLFCVTDRGFNRFWPRIAGDNSGLVDRFFLVMGPKKPKPIVRPKTPVFAELNQRTIDNISRAMEIGSYDSDPEAMAKSIEGLDEPRSQEMVIKLALYFAIDLGRDLLDADCYERARKLVDYQDAVRAYLNPIEADNPQARIQKLITRELERNNGRMTRRDLCNELDYTRFGSDVWDRAYNGLLKQKQIVEFDEKLVSGQTSRMVGLVADVREMEA